MRRGVTKLFSAIVSAAVIMLFLTSCSASSSRERSDLRKRLLVSAIGIDPEDSGYSFSFLCFSPEPSDVGKPSDSSESSAVTVTVRGKSLSEAIRNLHLKTGKNVFIGDTEIIVFGSGFANGEGTSLSPLLDCFWNSSEIYMGTPAVFSSGRADELLSLPSDTGLFPSEELLGIVSASREQGESLRSGLVDIYNALYSGGGYALMPIITREDGKDSESSQGEGGDSESSSENSPQKDSGKSGVFSSVVLSDGIPIGEIDSETVKGISVLTGEVKEVFLSIGESTARVNIFSLGRSANLTESGESAEASFVVSCGITPIEAFDYGNSDKSEFMEEFSDELLRLLASSYDESMNGAGADVLNLEKLIQKECTVPFSDFDCDFAALARNACVDITVKAKFGG